MLLVIPTVVEAGPLFAFRDDTAKLQEVDQNVPVASHVILHGTARHKQSAHLFPGIPVEIPDSTLSG